MIIGKCSRYPLNLFLRPTGILAALTLLGASLQTKAATSNEVALRSRVQQLYTVLQQGDWRKAEKFFTKESRPVFRSQPKRAVTEFQIDSIRLDADGKTAAVVVRTPLPQMMIAGPPVFVPVSTRWRQEGGHWYMELPDPHAATPLPMLGAQPQPSSTAPAAHSTDLKFQSTWASVGFVHKGEVKVARFTFTNVSQHAVTVADVHTDCACLRIKSQQKEVKPGEDGVLEFELDPSSFSFKTKMGLTLTATVETEPEHALTVLTIAASLTTSTGQPSTQ